MKKTKRIKHEPWEPGKCQLDIYNPRSAKATTREIKTMIHIVKSTEGLKVSV